MFSRIVHVLASVVDPDRQAAHTQPNPRAAHRHLSASVVIASEISSPGGDANAAAPETACSRVSADLPRESAAR